MKKLEICGGNESSFRNLCSIVGGEGGLGGWVGGGSKLLALYHKMNNNIWVEKIMICVFHVVK